MIVLDINDPVKNVANTWWFNFLYSLSGNQIIHDIEAELAKWNAKVVIDPDTNIGRTIQFDNDEDAAMFLLRWS